MSNFIKLYSNLETILSKEIMSRGNSPSKTCAVDKSRHSKEIKIAVLIVVISIAVSSKQAVHNILVLTADMKSQDAEGKFLSAIANSESTQRSNSNNQSKRDKCICWVR